MAVSSDEIEVLVRGRRTALARRAIAAFLRKHRRDADAVLTACDWFRRLGLPAQGFRLVAPGLQLRKSGPLTLDESRMRLWAARFLNLMGAPELALPLLDRLELRTAEEFRVAGVIHLTDYEPAAALRCFDRMEALAADDWGYPMRLARLSRADALCALGRTEAALRLVAEIFARTSEPLLRAICRQAEGEFLARSGDWANAIGPLREAETLFPPGDRTADMGVLQKWLGYVHARAELGAKARSAFAQARAILESPKLRPEAWLEIRRLEAEAGLLTAEERVRLAYYPGVSPGFRRQLGPVPPFDFGVDAASAQLRIDLAADEWREPSGRWRLGLPRELRLLGAVGVTGPWGLNTLKAKCLLWPGEVHSFLQLEDRLQQLLRRLRERWRMPIAVREGVIRLSPGAQLSVRAGGESWPHFLASAPRITPKSLGRYYGIGRTRAQSWLGRWCKEGREALPRCSKAHVVRTGHGGYSLEPCALS